MWYSLQATGAGRQYAVQVTAANDAGHQDDFLVGGTLTVAGR